MEILSNELTRTCNNLPRIPKQAAQQQQEERAVVSTYKENRRANLIALEKRFGSLEALSDHVGVSASYLSQMKKLRHMGDKVARRIEKRLNLPGGSMDWPSGAVGNVGQQTAKAATTMKMPTLTPYTPDANIQQFLKDFFEIPLGLRIHLIRRMAQFKAYSDKLTTFQRAHFPMPPDDEAGWLQWRNQLEAEIEQSIRFESKKPEKKPEKNSPIKT